MLGALIRLRRKKMPRIKELLNDWKGTIAALAALLIVIAALINGVNDTWVAWRGLPIGAKEKINSQLFKVHWKEDPIHTKQIIIEGKNGKIPITLDVYKNGDIFVDYVRLTQWFPYSTVIAQNDFHFINSAYAGFFDKIKKTVKTQMHRIVNIKKSKKTVERTRLFEDGSKEIQTIDINTGEIISIKNIEPDKDANTITPSNNAPNTSIEVIKLPKSSNDKVQVYKIDE